MDSTSNAKYKVYAIAIFSMLLWGMSFVWTSIVLKYYDPIAIIFLRLVISAGILFLFLRITGKLQKIQKKDYTLLLLSALFNPFLYFIGENFGLKFASPSIAAVIIATIPLFTPLVARFTLKEKLPVINILGILISFIGITIMLVNPDLSLNASPKGVIMLLLAVASAVVYSIFLKKLTDSYSAINIIAYQNLLGVILFLPVFLIFDLQNVLATPLNFELVSSLLSLAVFASSLAFIFFTMTVKEIGVSRANAFSNLIPVFTGVFSYIFISEFFTVNKIIGMVVVILGVLITQLIKVPGKNKV